MKNYVSGELLQAVKKSLSTIKISGMRTDDTKEFYKKVLSDSKPYKFYVTYPDGHGDIAMIFTRITENEKIRFVSIVTDIETGIRDCFGFFEISKFECSKILERFLKDEKTLEVPPEAFKTLLHNAEIAAIKNNHNKWKFPYEYVCWKNLLIDIDYDEKTVEEIVSEKIPPADVDISAISKLEEMKVSSHWFLDMAYSPEFIEVLKQLKISENLDKLVEDNLDKVFDKTEDEFWTKKIIISAYLKYVTGKTDDAGLIYGITRNATIKRKLFGEILKRSIYEYLTVIKYDKNIESYGLTYENINDKINYIEEKWAGNV